MRWLSAFLFVIPVIAGAQPLLDFRDDLAFRPQAVDTFAERAYRERLYELAAAGNLDADRALLDRIRHIVARLGPAAVYGRPAARAISWEVHVCRKCNENAAAMAGGRLLVGAEFIESIAPTDSELAYLLAHEMAHVLAEHTREFATTARFFVGNGLQRNYEDIQRELDESIAVNLRMAPEYVQQELEADYVGFILGARAGFDPDAMLSLLRKLGRRESSFLMLHPGENQRVRQAQTMLEAARRIYSRRWRPVDSREHIKLEGRPMRPDIL